MTRPEADAAPISGPGAKRSARSLKDSVNIAARSSIPTPWWLRAPWTGFLLYSILPLLATSIAIQLPGGWGFLAFLAAMGVALLLAVWSTGAMLVWLASLALVLPDLSRKDRLWRTSFAAARLLILPMAIVIGQYLGFCAYVVLHYPAWKSEVDAATAADGDRAIAVFNLGGMTFASSAYAYDASNTLKTTTNPNSETATRVGGKVGGCAEYNIMPLFGHWYHIGCGS